MTEIIIDASNVSTDVLVYLKKANDGHYYISRKPNKDGSAVDNFPISTKFAEQLQTMNAENAWKAMENHTGAGLGTCKCDICQRPAGR